LGSAETNGVGSLDIHYLYIYIILLYFIPFFFSFSCTYGISHLNPKSQSIPTPIPIRTLIYQIYIYIYTYTRLDWQAKGPCISLPARQPSFLLILNPVRKQPTWPRPLPTNQRKEGKKDSRTPIGANNGIEREMRSRRCRRNGF
jgi:hypothetical protein